MFELWRAQRSLERLEKKRDRDLKEARDRGVKGEEFGRLDEEWYFEISQAEEEYRHLRSRRLMREARMKLLPLPDGSDSALWQKGKYFRGRYLTDEGVMRVRNMLRQEAKARFDPIFSWGGLTLGAVGALSGLLAILGVRIG